MSSSPTTSFTRVGTLTLTWAVLLLSTAYIAYDVGLLFDARTALFLVVLPLLALAAAHPPAHVLRALRDGFSARSIELPPERRAASATILRSLGGVSFAVGLVVFLGSFVSTLNAVAASGGQVVPAQMIGSFGTMSLGPVYGLALKAFLYEPLAASLTTASSGLGTEL